MKINIKDENHTDELYTRLYTCPNCNFENIPRAYDIIPDNLMTAKYCPGCGEEIEWEA